MVTKFSINLKKIKQTINNITKTAFRNKKITIPCILISYHLGLQQIHLRGFQNSADPCISTCQTFIHAKHLVCLTKQSITSTQLDIFTYLYFTAGTFI